MGKRKTSTARYSQRFTPEQQTFYTKPSKTIDFTQAQPKTKARTKSTEMIPKTVNQEKYIIALQDNATDIVVVSGPAGTGKTYLGMIAAIRAFQSGKCDKIIMTRPAVAVDDEKHGFLPGDLNAKMEPWTRPLFDVLYEFFSVKDVEYMLEEKMIEITPLAFCRGRNFKHAYVILDEAQNATPNQLKMIMTRIGIGSKIIICGDIEQGDRLTKDNGLLDLKNRLLVRPIKGLSIVEFNVKDVQRHKIIEEVLACYSK